MEENQEPPKRKRIPRDKKPVKVIIKARTRGHKGAILTKQKKKIQIPKRVDDYLKYFRIVRFWAMKSHNITYLELEFCLFLFSEPVFTKSQWEDYDKALSYSKTRFQDMMDKGIIIKYGRGGGSQGRHILYTLGYKYKQMCSQVYNMLNGNKKIPAYFTENKIYGKKNIRGGYITAKQFKEEFESHNTKKSLFDPDSDFEENINDTNFLED